MGRLEKLMRDLLKKLFEDEGKEPPQYISEMDRDSLLDAVRKYLQHKRSVVIVDDVWSVKLWAQIENALLDNNNGSRILITTRSREVVTSCKNSPFNKVHELKPLTLKSLWNFFARRHSNVTTMNFSDFVEKCKGLCYERNKAATMNFSDFVEKCKGFC